MYRVINALNEKELELKMNEAESEGFTLDKFAVGPYDNGRNTNADLYVIMYKDDKPKMAGFMFSGI